MSGISSSGMDESANGTKSPEEDGAPFLLSPLRYPGGKRRLAEYVGEALSLNGIKPKLFVEPFAGGASVSLYVLSKGFVEKIALGEKDPLVAAFWNVVFNDSEWLVDAIANTPMTIPNWLAMKKLREGTVRQRALACLFLNRTSFSGILHEGAGPIGGLAQTSEYKLNCRFPVERILQQIAYLHGLRDKVEFVNEGSWRSTMTRAAKLDAYSENQIFHYLDPPFYNKANRLYAFYFKERDHRALCHYLSTVRSPWLVSYDPADAIVKMYSDNGFSAQTIRVLYSATADGTRVAREVVLTSMKKVPERTRMWTTRRR